MSEPPRDPYERYRPQPSSDQPAQGAYGRPEYGYYPDQPPYGQQSRPRFIPAAPEQELPPTSMRRGYTQQVPPQPPPGYYYPQQPQGYQQQQQQRYQQQPPAAPPRKKRRVFMWVFFAIQVLFIIWIVTGIASKGSGPTTAAQAAQQCANGGWQGLFQSQADCVKHYSVALNDAADTGKGIGVALIVIVWVVVDFFLGLGYGVYRLATRSR